MQEWELRDGITRVQTDSNPHMYSVPQYKQQKRKGDERGDFFLFFSFPFFPFFFLIYFLFLFFLNYH